MLLLGRKFSFSLSVIFTILSVFSLILAAAFIFFVSGFVAEHAVQTDFINKARNDASILERSLIMSMREDMEKKDSREIVRKLEKFDFGANGIQATLRSAKNTPVTDYKLSAAVSSGKESISTIDDGRNVRYLYPIYATFDCLSCHASSKVGGVLGFIDMTFPSSSVMVSLGYSTRAAFLYTIFGMWLMFGILYINLKFKVWDPITQMTNNIKAITMRRAWDQRVAANHDISELQSLATDFNHLVNEVQIDHAQLEELAIKDPLTGLLNRRGFDSALDAELTRANRHNHAFSIASIDLDNFKFINDTYGHPAGDLVLAEVASRLQRCLRKLDTFARLGGDEFVIILPETNYESGLLVVQKLRDALVNEPFSLPATNIQVTASIGVAGFPRDGNNRETLHSAVDAVLYKAKRCGKNRVVSLDGTEEENDPSLFLGRAACRLQRALNEGRIDVALQPIVSVKDGVVIAYEALARIIEDGRVISACDFIESAEEAGLIKHFDTQVFRKGVERLKRLPPNIKMFFNFSAASFSDHSWMRALPSMLSDAGIECSRIIIEITEREALPHMESVKHIIDELRGTGMQFALDDFGSGFSGFLYIKLFNVDYLKIDGSFVRQMSKNGCDRIIVESIQHIATEFRLKTVAEFVEDEETAQLLSDIGVDTAQGYYFGRPKIHEDDDANATAPYAGNLLPAAVAC